MTTKHTYQYQRNQESCTITRKKCSDKKLRSHICIEKSSVLDCVKKIKKNKTKKFINRTTSFKLVTYNLNLFSLMFNTFNLRFLLILKALI